jgi:hypothetical protein
MPLGHAGHNVHAVAGHGLAERLRQRPRDRPRRREILRTEGPVALAHVADGGKFREHQQVGAIPTSSHTRSMRPVLLRLERLDASCARETRTSFIAPRWGGPRRRGPR